MNPSRIARGGAGLVHAAHMSGDARSWLLACGQAWIADGRVEAVDEDVSCAKCRRALTKDGSVGEEELWPNRK